MTKQQNINLTPQQLADHDLLVTGIEKLNQLSVAVKEINDNISSRLTVLETKSDHYDKILAKASPLELQKIAFQNQKNIQQIKTAYKIVIAVIVAISGIIIYILNVGKLSGLI